jgi:hypothetical protein
LYVRFLRQDSTCKTRAKFLHFRILIIVITAIFPERLGRLTKTPSSR